MTPATASNGKTVDPKLAELVQRVVDGRLTIDQIRMRKAELADKVETLIAERGESTGDEIDDLLAEAKPVVTAVRYGNGNEFYDLSEAGIAGADRGKYNWLPRPIVDKLIAAATGDDGTGDLADALAAAQLAFESGEGIRLIERKKRTRS